jgi:hypothetical protein
VLGAGLNVAVIGMAMFGIAGKAVEAIRAATGA